MRPSFSGSSPGRSWQVDPAHGRPAPNGWWAPADGGGTVGWWAGAHAIRPGPPLTSQAELEADLSPDLPGQDDLGGVGQGLGQLGCGRHLVFGAPNRVAGRISGDQLLGRARRRQPPSPVVPVDGDDPGPTTPRLSPVGSAARDHRESLEESGRSARDRGRTIVRAARTPGFRGATG